MTNEAIARGTIAARESRAMGSPLRLLVSGPSAESEVEAAWAAVRDEFEAAEQAMSAYRETSEITLLRRADPTTPLVVSGRLRRALAVCDRARRLTGGRFDARVVADLERLGFGGVPQRDGRTSAPGDSLSRGDVATPPTAARTSPGSTAAPSPSPRVFDCAPGGAIALREPVDLGGIGKGLALRWAAAAVERLLDVPSPPSARPSAAPHAAGLGFLIDAGGDIVVRGASAPGEPWWVGIEDPAGSSAPLAAVALEGRAAIATSSTRIHRRETDDGRFVHHLIDPRTHESAAGGLAAVTVAGPDPAWAEVWSKALFVEGSPGIASLARTHGLAAWWIAEDGGVEMTPAARQLTAWAAGER